MSFSRYAQNTAIVGLGLILAPFFLLAMLIGEYTILLAIVLTIAGGTIGWFASLSTIGWSTGILGVTFMMMLWGVADEKFGVYFRRSAFVVGLALLALAITFYIRFQGLSVHIEVPMQ
jgi:hypothetical protein